MRFDILTLFPEMFAGPLTESIIKRAIQAGHIDVALHNIRDWATDKHKSVDDTPYGGGAGMVMKPAPLAAAIRAARGQGGERTLTLLMAPDGVPFTQRVAEDLAGYDRLVLLCGRYEGVDERIRETLIDREISVGDFVLTGGELAAMIVLDVVSRLVPGVLDAASPVEESFGGGLLEYPQYTRPLEWEGRSVPDMLRSGNHAAIATWRHQHRLARTLRKRPDLLEIAPLAPADIAYLRSLGWQGGPKKR